MLHVRRAGPLDAAPMADLLNEVIAIGGTTAMTDPVTRADMLAWLDADPMSIWFVAEDEDGALLGFQWVDRPDETQASVCYISTFSRVGRTGLGIGSALFAATRDAARAAGFRFIEAEIRADNTGGLAYYQSRGFEEAGRKTGVRLKDGTLVDKVIKRFEL
ncbi:GNAT family N-acetyltransferase [Pseudooceanicola sp. LIPI14-2-Ac024]|uniref:GNAT family N-acetyltransferase n=1 Tax=Pseudooceanicola sp. LIPI14-2-Ac024 TaxID=3344875 RepID=UPI0035CF95E8